MGLFGKEKITMTLDKYDYKPGEKIKGKIKLNLKKPVEARKLEVRLRGIQIQKSGGGAIGAIGGNSNRNYSRREIYDFKMPISGEKEYHKEEFDFELPIPSDIGNQAMAKLGQKGQAAMQAFKVLTGSNMRVDWYLRAQLDIPKGLDVKKKQQIVISPE